MVEKTLFFDDLQVKSFDNEMGMPPIQNVFEDFTERVLSGDANSIDDLITEVANDNTSKYIDELLKNCMTMQMLPIINETIEEFGNFSSIEQLLRTAEYNYFSKKLYENAEDLIKNALVKSLKNKSITIQADEKIIIKLLNKIKEKIQTLIDKFKVNFSKPANVIIENFNFNICKELEANADEKTIFKFSENDDETENPILFFEVGQAPVVLNLSKNSKERLEQLQRLVGGRIETINIISKDKKYGVDLIVNEEGKLFNLPYNKPLRYSHISENESCEAFDVIVGNFVIVGVDFEKGDFVGLTERNLSYWKNQFENEKLYFIGSKYLDDEYGFTFKEPQQNNINNKEIDFTDDFEAR